MAAAVERAEVEWMIEKFRWSVGVGIAGGADFATTLAFRAAASGVASATTRRTDAMRFSIGEE
jgi:hypothetical protein